MSKANLTHPLAGFLFSSLALLAVSACDRPQERMERAQSLGSAVLDQISGKAPVEKVTRLEDVPVEARAVAGRIQSVPLASSASRAERLYVVGSIVAKPRNLPQPLAMAEVVAEPELVDTVVTEEPTEAKIVVLDPASKVQAENDPQVIEKIETASTRAKPVTVVDPAAPAPAKSIYEPGIALPRKRLSDEIYRRQLEKEGVEAPLAMQAPAPPKTRAERIASMPKLEPRVAERALTLRSETLQRQIAAEDRMIRAATKYGVAASIQRSRTGQMVIEIGDDAMSPTQFSGEQAPRAPFAVETDIGCDTPDLQEAQHNTAYAMECIMQELRDSGEFEYVEKDYLFEHQMIRRPSGPPVTTDIIPNDPLFGLQWNFKNRGSEAGQSPGGAGFVDFWTREGTQGSPNVVVAIVDTGLEMAHPDIAGSPNVMPGWDMVTDPLTGNDGDGRDSDANDPGDMCPERGAFSNSYHGTHVAGTVGAGVTNNALGVAGGAWNVHIVPVRALGKCGGRLSDINDAIRWAAGTIPDFDELGNEVWNENPADIINLSIGLFKSCPASMQDAIDAVTAEGVIVVAAAGNNRISTDFYAPAGCRNVVTVAGGDARGFLAPYSNYGDAVDILAPGGDLSRDDDGDGNPDGVLSTKTAENCLDPVSGDTVSTCYYSFEQGTSMAAPHVAAALALIKAKRPDLSASELVSRLSDGLSVISGDACTGPCNQYPGAEPIAGDPAMCRRPCGAGQLNLAGINLSD